MPSPSPESADTARLRHDLPEVLFVDDVMLHFGFKDPTGARRAIHRGDLGNFFYVGRRIALLRETVLQALRERGQAQHAARGTTGDGLSPYREALFGTPPSSSATRRRGR